MELQHFSHIHRLVFNEEPCNAICSGCGCLVSGPSFSCMPCRFFLDKECAEAPFELAHPFHHKHNLNLLTSNPYELEECQCDFCHKDCKNFVYHCSCKLDLHIRCALFSYKIAEKKIGELQFVDVDPLMFSTEIHSEELKVAECCLACWKHSLDSAYLSVSSEFCLHKKCLELPLEINHLCHHHSPLFLQIPSKSDDRCQICQSFQPWGFAYCCSRCQFLLHIVCVSSSPIIEDRRRHEHPFSRFFRRIPFICDACGTLGNYVSYICSTCSLIVHEKCISLPRIIKNLWHHHPLSHKYFEVDNEWGTLECGICHKEVNKDYGSYCCSECKFVVHVNCAYRPGWYSEIRESSEDAYYQKLNEYQLLAVKDPSFFVIREISLEENAFSTVIKHFSHEHDLVSSDEVNDERYCDGCSLLITSSFYRCFKCKFCLHKSCVELPKKKQIWDHAHQQPLDLFPNCIFKCYSCGNHRSGFAYRCEICRECFCVLCAKFSYSLTSQGHVHPLLFSLKVDTGECNACGGSVDNEIAICRCKGCNFNLHFRCSLLPQKAAHKCDKHLLKLTYHENNDYSECHYCDICEERRNPSNWFYLCTICNTSAHPKCVLGYYPFMKRGIRIFSQRDHQHRLVAVQKVYDYTEACCKCGRHCLDLALECSETGCNYIIHWWCSTIGRRLQMI